MMRVWIPIHTVYKGIFTESDYYYSQKPNATFVCKWTEFEALVLKDGDKHPHRLDWDLILFDKPDYKQLYSTYRLGKGE